MNEANCADAARALATLLSTALNVTCIRTAHKIPHESTTTF